MTFDRVLLTKRLLRLPLRLRRLCGYSWIKRFPLLFGNAICCPATAYRKETAGTPLIRSDDRFVLDWACLLRLSRLKGRFICEEKPLLLYREHALSATSACIKDRARAKEERAMFSALWPEWAAAILARFYSSASDAYMS